MSRRHGKKTAYKGVIELRPPSGGRGGKSRQAGEYRIRVYYQDPKTGRQRERDRVIKAASADEAFAMRHEVRREAAEESLHRNEERKRVLDCVISWLSGRKSEVKPSTWDMYEYRLQSAVDAFGDVYLDMLTRSDIEKWRDSQTDAPETINGRLQAFKTFCQEVTADIGMPNPAKNVKRVRRPHRPDGSQKTLTAGELGALLDAVEKGSPQWYPLILTLATTAGRFGEISALHWSDIDFEQGEITIQRAHNRNRVGDTKTGVRRRVALAPELAKVLKAHRKELMRSQAPGFDKDYVFPSNAGTYTTPSSIRDALHRAAVAIGIARYENGKLEGRKVSAHWLRHTFNNLLRGQTTDIVQRSITGHATEDMSEHYSHVSLAEKQQALRSVMSIVRRTEAKPGTQPGTGQTDTQKPNNAKGPSHLPESVKGQSG